MAFPAQLVTLARRAAATQSLDPALVCAVVEQESAWNPWAIRYEPLFFAKYVASLYTNNKVSASEAYARGFSWGLMQVMGQVARETGFDALFLSALCDPEQGPRTPKVSVLAQLRPLDAQTTLASSHRSSAHRSASRDCPRRMARRPPRSRETCR